MDESLQVGDWVRTPSGHEGKIVLVQRLSAFIDYGNEAESGPASCLLSELTKIDPPQPAEENRPTTHYSASDGQRVERPRRIKELIEKAGEA